MNRVIKFRAWDGDRMLYSTDTHNKTPGWWAIIIFGLEETSETVMQFTGLLDKNGVEIYEGDVVEWSNFNGHPYRRVVVYLAPQFYLAPNLTEQVNVETFSTPTIHETIIGNIYENPELLTKDI